MSITVDRSGVNRIFSQLPRIADSVWQDAGVVFKQETPVRSGNARRKTATSKTQIKANYAYAGVLDAGRGYRDGQVRGSQQAPDGMSKPTIDYIEKELQKRVRPLNKRS